MNVELIKQEVVPVFQPMTVQVTIGTQEEYDAIQRAGKSLIMGEINSLEGFATYSYSEKHVWCSLLDKIAVETKNVN